MSTLAQQQQSVAATEMTTRGERVSHPIFCVVLGTGPFHLARTCERTSASESRCVRLYVLERTNESEMSKLGMF